VRDDERDLVDVPDDREQRSAAGARDPHPRRAEHVGVHLAERSRFLAPDRGGELFLPGRSGSREQAQKTVGDRHGDNTNEAGRPHG
jgi:hypothetical protein